MRARVALLGTAAFGALCALAVLGVTLPARADTQSVVGPAKLAAVKKLPVPIYLPAALPPGLRLKNFDVQDPRKPDSHGGWGYSLEAKGPHAALSISESTYEFGAGEVDYKGFRRPFTVTSPVFGQIRFEPDSDDDYGWCYAGSVDVPGATKPPQRGHQRPVLDIAACGIERDGVERLLRSMEMVKAQTPYPKT